MGSSAKTASRLLVLSLLAAAPRLPETQTFAADGRPSAAALASARSKQAAMRQASGPQSVTLSPDEMASLIQAGLHAEARRALDSIRVRLEPGRIALHAYLLTASLDTLLGPIAMLLGPREPMAVAGPARSVKAGLIAWEPDNFTIRSFAFPQAAIPHLVNQLTGGSDGTIPIAVPPTVRQIRIQPAGVTFSRQAG